jgi:hypothetical protein
MWDSNCKRLKSLKFIPFNEDFLIHHDVGDQYWNPTVYVDRNYCTNQTRYSLKTGSHGEQQRIPFEDRRWEEVKSDKKGFKVVTVHYQCR